MEIVSKRTRFGDKSIGSHLVSEITIDELQTLICHSPVLPGMYGVTAMSLYTIGCVTLDSYRVRTPAVNTLRESRRWRVVTDPYLRDFHIRYRR
jgi:hypothetical protein